MNFAEFMTFLGRLYQLQFFGGTDINMPTRQTPGPAGGLPPPPPPRRWIEAIISFLLIS